MSLKRTANVRSIELFHCIIRVAGAQLRHWLPK